MKFKFVGGTRDGQIHDVDCTVTEVHVAVELLRFTATSECFQRIELGDDGLPVPSYRRSRGQKYRKEIYGLQTIDSGEVVYKLTDVALVEV